jgi:hypothetical protein
LSDFNEISIFLTEFQKNTQISNLMKICPVGAKLIHADGWTDTMKLIAIFHNFASAPKNHSGKPFVTFLLSPYIQAFSVLLAEYQMNNVKKNCQWWAQKEHGNTGIQIKTTYQVFIITDYNFLVPNNVWQQKLFNTNLTII